MMSHDQSVSGHYLHGGLLEAIEAALPALGKLRANVTIEDPAPVDEFHTSWPRPLNICGH